jgi:hypothetical protein
MSDSSPGAIAHIDGQKFRLFNGKILSKMLPMKSECKPGDFIGVSKSAVCFKTADDK